MKKTYKKKKILKTLKKNMKGGYNEDEILHLHNLGFTDYQIEDLENLNVSYQQILNKVDEITNRGDGQSFNSDALTSAVLSEIEQENNLNTTIQNDDDDHTIDLDSQGSLHLSDLNLSDDSLNTSDLNISQHSEADTTNEDLSFGSFGGKKSRKSKKSKRISKKSKRITKKYRKKGGVCYGRGIGANNYDPNYSIYNTNMLKLFPYK